MVASSTAREKVAGIGGQPDPPRRVQQSRCDAEVISCSTRRGDIECVQATTCGLRRRSTGMLAARYAGGALPPGSST
jgi:hypothetical protein